MSTLQIPKPEDPIRLCVFTTPTGGVVYEYWKDGKPISPVFNTLDQAKLWLNEKPK